MGRWLVKETCKAGPDCILVAGTVVDLSMPQYAGKSAKFVELASAGLLETYGGPLSGQDEAKAQEAQKTVSEVETEESPLDAMGEVSSPLPSTEEDEEPAPEQKKRGKK